MHVYEHNFFVFQSYELRFSGLVCLILKRSFLGYMVYSVSESDYPYDSVQMGSYRNRTFLAKYLGGGKS